MIKKMITLADSKMAENVVCVSRPWRKMAIFAKIRRNKKYIILNYQINTFLSHDSNSLNLT